MRKAFIAALPALILISCTRDSGIAPSVVLEKAVVASQSVQSARFQGSMQILNMQSSFPVENGHLSFEGIMRNGGNQLSSTFDIKGETHAKESLQFGGKLMVLNENETYVFIERLAFPGTEELTPKLQEVLSVWWLLPATSSGATGESISPDPRLLRMQAEIVDVIRDRGVSRDNGADVIAYDVVLNKDKLTAFLAGLSQDEPPEMDPVISALFDSTNVTGRLWIDADTFIVRRVLWNLKSVDEGSTSEMKLSIEFSDIGTDETIVPPESAFPLPSDFLSIIPSNTMNVTGPPMTEIYTTD